MSNVTLENDVYTFKSDTAWYLVHDGTNVIIKGQGGEVGSKYVILEYETEQEMETAIIALGLIENEE